MADSNPSISQITGQMLVSGFEGTRLTAETEALVRNHHLGGLILFPRNYESPQQLHALISELQALAEECMPGRPLFISVDQEGGRVARLTAPFTRYPEPGTLGHADSEDLAQRFGRALGEELASVGVNMDYAPVLDVNSNPANPIIGDRAFSTTPDRAGALACAFMHGMEAAGVLAVGKHFPGHGDTTTDSHLELPTVARDAPSLETLELPPFAQAVREGLKVMMTAHVVYPAWDEENPATFSPFILRTLLRERMGYEGLIMSDDLEMKAIDPDLPFDTMARKGVEAGIDLFLICHDTDKVAHLHRALIEGLESGVLPGQEVEASRQRIHRVKSFLKPVPKEPPDPSRWQEAHNALAAEMAAHLSA